jgi:hypothetical protein
MNKALKKFFNKQVAYEKFIKIVGNGDRQYAPSTNINCVYTGKSRIVINEKGEQVVSTITLFVEGGPVAAGITLKDRITLLDGRKVPIQGLAPVFNLKGDLELLEVYV